MRLRRRRRATLFPYTTLFRSDAVAGPSPEDWGSQDPKKAHHWSFRTAAYHGVVTWSPTIDRKSTRLNSSHRCISYAVFCLKKKKRKNSAGPKSAERADRLPRY